MQVSELSGLEGNLKVSSDVCGDGLLLHDDGYVLDYGLVRYD